MSINYEIRYGDFGTKPQVFLDVGQERKNIRYGYNLVRYERDKEGEETNYVLGTFYVSRKGRLYLKSCGDRLAQFRYNNDLEKVIYSFITRITDTYSKYQRKDYRAWFENLCSEAASHVKPSEMKIRDSYSYDHSVGQMVHKHYDKDGNLVYIEYENI